MFIRIAPIKSTHEPAQPREAPCLLSCDPGIIEEIKRNPLDVIVSLLHLNWVAAFGTGNLSISQMKAVNAYERDRRSGRSAVPATHRIPSPIICGAY